MEDTEVYYEEVFSEALPAFEALYSEYLEKAGKKERAAQKMLKSTDAIIARINQIIGTPDANKKTQRMMFEAFLRPAPKWKRIYLLRKETVKDYLRNGGTIEGMSYNREKDKVSYEPFFSLTPESVDFDFFHAVASADALESETKETFEKLHTAFGQPGIALHEVVEGTLIFERIRPADPYWRWFTDGFANAIAIELLKEYLDEESAKEFAAIHDTAEYKDMESEINLMYWKSKNFCIKTPIDYPEKLSNARYDFATLEARRLVEKHGIECVSRILDEACTEKPNPSSRLLPAIKKVTGEDMEARLKRYQTFDTLEQGIAKYTELYNKALDQKDYGKMLAASLRILELRETELIERKFSAVTLETRENASYLLYKMGYVKEADAAMYGFLRTLRESKYEKMHGMFLQVVFGYAVRTRNVEKIAGVAEGLLSEDADYVPALAVKMRVSFMSKKMDEGKTLARRICTLVKDEQSPFFKEAARLLSKERNNASHE